MAKKGLHVNVYKIPGKNVYRCDLKLNTSEAGEGVTIRGTSEDDGRPAMMGSFVATIKSKLSHAGQALSKARTAMKALVGNPAVLAAFPEYVGPALLALEAIEKAEAHGILPTVKKKLTDPTLKKFAREMDEMSKGQRQAMSGGGICLACGDSDTRRAMMGFIPPPFGLETQPGARTPFGLPPGNPHPFAEWVRAQIIRGANADPLYMQRLARMQEQQRREAKNER